MKQVHRILAQINLSILINISPEISLERNMCHNRRIVFRYQLWFHLFLENTNTVGWLIFIECKSQLPPPTVVWSTFGVSKSIAHSMKNSNTIPLYAIILNVSFFWDQKLQELETITSLNNCRHSSLNTWIKVSN